MTKQNKLDRLLSDILNSFPLFLALVWSHLRLPQPTAIQNDIALYLQLGPNRRVIQAFRGVGKSWITAAYVCWLLLRDPDVKILVVSASKSRADDFTTFVKRLIDEMPILQHLAPREGQRDSKLSFDVGPAKASQSPSVKSVGITGMMTGSRAQYVIADDIEVPNNSLTQANRERLAEAVKEFDAVLKPGGSIIYLGTPQTEESIYYRLPARGYDIRVWPARYPDEARLLSYGSRLAPYIQERLTDSNVGQSTDPKRFTDIDLQERELSYGRSGFALQFMLDTTLSDAERYPLKLKDLVMFSCTGTVLPGKIVWSGGREDTISHLPLLGFDGDVFQKPIMVSRDTQDWTEPTGSVLFIDPSGRGSDELGYAVVKHLHGNLYVPSAGGLQGGYSDDNMIKIAEMARKHSVRAIVVESNFGDGMFSELLKPHLRRIYPCSVEEVRHSKQKELRIIDTLEPVMNQHRLIVDPSVVEDDFKTIQQYTADERRYYSLFYQLTHITKERGALKHDDRLDALAGAVAYWTQALAKDQDKSVEQRRAKLIDDELRAFVATVNKRKGTQTTFTGAGYGRAKWLLKASRR